VGQEEEGHPERQMAKDLGIADQVKFVGYSNDVLPLLSAADVYVMPSLYEGFSIAALEAVATGIPAILTDVNGLKDMKSIDGVYYVQLSFLDLASKLVTVASLSFEKRQTFITNQVGQVNDLYSIKRGADSYMQLYNQLLSTK
jgi:glycosyltransferase involved in cell wall biosynthesis